VRPLSKEVPSSSISKANEEVQATLEKLKKAKKFCTEHNHCLLTE
jgi:hypothetical protein